MKKEIKWSIAAVLLLCMGVVVYFLFLRPAPVSHTTFFLAEGLAGFLPLGDDKFGKGLALQGQRVTTLELLYSGLVNHNTELGIIEFKCRFVRIHRLYKRITARVTHSQAAV